jgi:hypothetical protein
MNKWVTISLVGFAISTGLITCLSIYLSEHPEMYEMYFTIAALVIFCVAWGFSTGTLIYHICVASCRPRTARDQPEIIYWNNQHHIQTASPLVPATPSAPPLYDDDD